MTPLDLALAVAVVTLGATLQGTVGFGANLVAAPLLTLIDPQLVPGPIVVVALLLNALVVRRERDSVALAEVRWALVGLVPGTLAGAAALALLPEDGLSLFFAIVVLVAVALSMSGLHPPMRPPALLGAGTASGFMGTVTAIGGPPIAMMYQRQPGATLRGTLGRFFLVSGLLSLAGLLAVGRIGLTEVGVAALLVPGVLAGYGISRLLVGHVDRGHTRAVVLALSALSAVTVIVTTLR
ncbi:sulfite exporter TauE/SafE family protein [soil metagenome]